ncbi:hypothetical protein QI633_13720 [Nocardioides sp. QY071]|uniref:hypothetical protein n=1 Tax=Nocardioides sp. QY071 TaxID=3044187 RepID=UPI00249AC1FA|nr:hypothetical protein [Nocardioides sp. QY071]WGX99597.1 hypothetical protein QI633_13720 [Nocardioides sp. QY071]
MIYEGDERPALDHAPAATEPRRLTLQICVGESVQASEQAHRGERVTTVEVATQVEGGPDG